MDGQSEITDTEKRKRPESVHCPSCEMTVQGVDVEARRACSPMVYGLRAEQKKAER